MNSPATSRARRPFWLSLLAFCLALLSLAGWLRLVESISRWQFLLETGVQPGPFYLAVTGLLIGAAGLVAAMGIWFRKRWAPGYTRILAVLWLGWLWLDRLLVASSPTALANWPFLLGSSVLILVYVFGCLGRGTEHFQ